MNGAERNLFDSASDDRGMSGKAWTERDVDAVLAGRRPQDEDLLVLAPIFGALRSEAAQQPEDGLVASFAAELALVTAAVPQPAAVAKTSRRSPFVRRLSLAGVGAVLLGAGVAGAAAANGSAPGDPLYGVDRALERAGINDGGMRERVNESLKLEDEGDTDKAIEHVCDALESDGESDAAASLDAAARTIQSNGSANSAAVHAAVADMLLWMASTDLEGRDFGQGVAEHAHAIGATHDPKGGPKGPDGAGTGANGGEGGAATPQSPNGPKATPPGKDNTHPPAKPNKPEKPHKPEKPQKPEKPATPAKPERPSAAASSHGKPSD